MNENNLEYTQIKRNPSAIEGGGADHKGKELGKLEQCIYVICLLIIACIEMWRINWKEMEILYLNCNEKVVYALNYEHWDFVRITEFLCCVELWFDEEMLKKMNMFLWENFNYFT